MENEIRAERFNSSEELEVITPDCRDCKYAINYGVDGCIEDYQTFEIQIGEEKCEMKVKDTV